MQGTNHLVFNATLAVATESLLHPAGPAFHWTNVFSWLAHAGAPSAVGTVLVYKCVYYSCTLLTARLPDVDQRIRIFGKHRGFTHSFVGVLFFAFALLGVGLLLTNFLLKHGIYVSQEVLTIGLLAILSLTLGCLFHIIGDSVTFKGVDFFWPSEGRVGVPQDYSIRNETWSEYIFVYCVMLVVGFLVGISFFGF